MEDLTEDEWNIVWYMAGEGKKKGELPKETLTAIEDKAYANFKFTEQHNGRP